MLHQQRPKSHSWKNSDIDNDDNDNERDGDEEDNNKNKNKNKDREKLLIAGKKDIHVNDAKLGAPLIGIVLTSCIGDYTIATALCIVSRISHVHLWSIVL